MTLRGIGNDSAKTEYADPEVGLFVNGVYAPVPAPYELAVDTLAFY